MGKKAFWLLLAALAAARLAMMATAPVFEPSEARYAVISANMARYGDFVVPRFTHDLEYQSFDGKPPLVFQAGGVFCKLFGVCEFAVRLFPFLSAALLLFILYHSVKKFHGGGSARLAVAVCASCTAFYAASGVAMTDMSLACCVAGALLVYRCFLDGFRLRYAFAAAALLGAGMIVKGPVALAMFGLPVLLDCVVNRRWKGVFNLKWLAAAPVFFAIAAPWFVLVEMRNPGAVWYFFYNENFLRFVSHDYGDKYGAGREAFRGVSLVWAFVVTLPWALLPLVSAWRLRRMPRLIPAAADFRSFELLSVLAITGFWCLTSRVLVYYLFPVVPLFAAYFAPRCDQRLVAWLTPWASSLTVAVLAAALAGGASFSDSMRGEKTPFSAVENHYAFEFYHGRKTEAELAPYRSARSMYMKLRAMRKAEASGAAKKNGGAK